MIGVSSLLILFLPFFLPRLSLHVFFTKMAPHTLLRWEGREKECEKTMEHGNWHLLLILCKVLLSGENETFLAREEGEKHGKGERGDLISLFLLYKELTVRRGWFSLFLSLFLSLHLSLLLFLPLLPASFLLLSFHINFSHQEAIYHTSWWQHLTQRNERTVELFEEDRGWLLIPPRKLFLSTFMVWFCKHFYRKSFPYLQPNSDSHLKGQWIHLNNNFPL